MLKVRKGHEAINVLSPPPGKLDAILLKTLYLTCSWETWSGIIPEED